MSDVVAADELRLLIERIERLEEEKKGIADDIRDVYSEAKARGYDAKILRQILRLRKMETHDRQEMEAMIMSTTTASEGRPVREYLGIVTGEVIVGANIFKDLFASVRDIVGGRSGSYETTLRDARKTALDEIAQEARALGADAVIGIDLDYEVLGQGGSMLMVTASGTAVKLG